MAVDPAQTGTQLVYSPHPFLASAGRQVVCEPFEDGESIAAYLGRVGIHLGNQPVVLTLDGDVVLREYWALTFPRPGSIIQIRAVMHGVDAGGNGGSDPARTVLTIAVIAAAIWTGGYAAVMTGSVYAQAAAAGITMYAGMAIVDGLVPVPAPDLANLGRGRDEQDSPTYSLSGGSNRMRAYEPMPLLIGRHRVFPDLSSQPFVEYDGEDQYLHQIFNFGLSSQRLSDFRIGDTPVDDFGNVEMVVSGDDGSVKLFPTNVDSLPVGARFDGATWVTRTSSVDAVGLSVDIVGSLFAVGDRGLESASALLQIEYRRIGTTTWLPAVNGYDPSGQYTHYWSAGSYRPDGLWTQWNYGTTDPDEHTEGDVYAVINSGIAGIGPTTVVWRWRPFSELVGVSAYDPHPPQGQYSKQENLLLSSASRKPLRKTYSWEVPRGQYEVRARWFHPYADQLPDSIIVNLEWTVLRTAQPDDTDYAGQLRVGVRARANAQLSGVMQQFSAVSEGWAYDWTGTEWQLGPTSNPASWFLWFALGKRDASGNRLYGALLPDSRIDMAALQEWHTWCAVKGLTSNMVVDRKMSCADVLAAIARCGRATYTWANGLLSVVWDADNQPETAVFGMANIVAGSFQVEYATEKLADEIVVRFVNPDIGWQQDTVRVPVPGASSPERPVTIDLWGCTDKSMAGAYANLRAAAQIYHRRRISWETDIEGQVAVRGDVVRLSHDLTQWGYSGRLVAGTTSELTLDEAVPFTSGESHYVSLRQPDGTWSTHPVDYQAGESDIITITAGSELPVAPDAGRPVDWLWFFAPAPTPGKRVKIVDARPVSEDRWRFVAIDEEPAYYAAEGGTFTHVPVSVQFPAPEVSDLTVSETVLNYQDNTVQVHITWRLRGSEKARVRIGLNGGDLQDYGEITGGYLDAVFRDGSELVIEVTAVVLAQLTSNPAAVATTQYTVGEYTLQTADPLPVPADVTGLELDGLEAEQGQGNAVEFTGRDVKLIWRKSATQRAYELGQEPRGGDSGQLDGTYDGYRVRVYHGDQFDAASLVREAHVRSNRFDYLYEMNAEDGLSRQVSVEVVGLDIYGNESARPARITVDNPAPELPLGVSVDARFQHFRLRYTEPSDLDFEGMRVWVGTTSGFAADDSTRVFDGPGELIVIDALADGTPLVTGGVYYVRFAPYDAFGRSGLNVSAEYQVTLQAIDPADTQGFSDWAFKLDPADKAWINAHLQAGSVDSTRIESLVASKIAAGILQATVEIQSGGMIRATNSGTDYEHRTGFEADGGTNYIVRYGNPITSHWPFSMDVDGNIAMEGALTFKAGTSGIANVADAGQLALQDDVDWSSQISGAGKPQDNATMTAAGNMIVNGSGDWGDNTNWSQWTLEADGSFSSAGTGNHFSDQAVPVSVHTQYQVEALFRTQDAGVTILAGFACLDENEQHIEYYDAWRDEAKNTTLYAATSTSSTTVDIVPAGEAWLPVSSPFSFVQFDIKNDGSDLPQQSIRILSIDTSAGTYWRLTLQSPPPAVYPAGTPVGNSHSGATYNYLLAPNTAPGTTFAEHKNKISGVNAVSEPPSYGKFRRGTKYVKAYVRPNYSGSSVTYVKDFGLYPLPSEPLLDALALQNGPAQAGADQTRSAIETGIALTAGAITYGTNIVIDLFNKFIGIGTAIWDTTIANIALDHNGGNPRAYIGDGDEAYFLFDAGAGIAEVGRDVELAGADSYHNQAVYDHYRTFSEILIVRLAMTAQSLPDRYKVTSGTTTVYYGAAEIRRALRNTALTWNKRRSIRVVVEVDSPALDNKIWLIGTGSYEGATNGYAAFRSINGDILGEVVANGGQPAQTGFFANFTADWPLKLEIDILPGEPRTDFYVGGSLVGSVNAVPSGAGADYQFFIASFLTADGPAGSVSFSEVFFLQAA